MRILPLIATLILLITPTLVILSQPDISVTGIYSCSQVWDSDTVKVDGDVTINGSLSIHPGACISFSGHYLLTADSIFAKGTISDSITFTIKDTTGFSNRNSTRGGWRGIIANQYMDFDYCRLMYGKNTDSTGTRIDEYDWQKTGLLKASRTKIQNSVFYHNYSYTLLFKIDRVDFRELFISDCRFLSNHFEKLHHGSTFGGKSTIANSTFIDNTFSIEHTSINGSVFNRNKVLGLYASEREQLDIVECVFRDNSELTIYGGDGMTYSTFHMVNTQVIGNANTTIASLSSIESQITGNLICYNTFRKAIIIADYDDLSIENNTFYENTLPKNEILLTVCNYGSFGFSNNILYGNGINNPFGFQVSMKDYRCKNTDTFFGIMRNNCIEDGIDAILYNGFSGVYENNISNEPVFKQPLSGDFRLNDNSPCINTGTSDTTNLNLPVKDLYGNPRILDFIVDIGAYEFKPGHLQTLSQPVGGSYCCGTEVFLSTGAYGGVLGYQWQKEGKDILSETKPTLHFISILTSQAGNYNCRIITADGIISTDTVQLFVNLPPSVSLGKDTTLHTGETLDLEADGNFVTYLWNTGAEDQVMPVSQSQAGDYDYWVTVTDSNNCESGDTIKVTFVSANAVQDHAKVFEMTVYPNPASDILYLSSDLDIDNTMISITDAGGKVCITQKIEHLITDIPHPISISGLKKGVYILIVDGSAVRFIKSNGT